MEQLKDLKEILLMGSQTASPDFTDTVMKRVNKLSTATFNYHPLVSNKIQRTFILVYLALVSYILFLCLVVGSAEFPLGRWIENLSLSIDTYYKILVFLFIFWIVFTVNTFMERKRIKAYWR